MSVKVIAALGSGVAIVHEAESYEVAWTVAREWATVGIEQGASNEGAGEIIPPSQVLRVEIQGPPVAKYGEAKFT